MHRTFWSSFMASLQATFKWLITSNYFKKSWNISHPYHASFFQILFKLLLEFPKVKFLASVLSFSGCYHSWNFLIIPNHIFNPNFLPLSCRPTFLFSSQLPLWGSTSNPFFPKWAHYFILQTCSSPSLFRLMTCPLTHRLETSVFICDSSLVKCPFYVHWLRSGSGMNSGFKS